MGSSAKTGKKNFRGSPEHFMDKNAIWDRTPPPHQLQSTCVEEGSRVPNLQMEFNYLDSFKSYGIFSDFVVPTWSSPSPSSSCCPHSPQKVPMWSLWSVVSTCCPHHPRRPHVLIAPRRSPCGLLGLWSPHVVPVIPRSSLSSPHRLEGPHIIPNPPDTHSTHPPPPWGVGPRISKNAIRFELIKIF